MQASLIEHEGEVESSARSPQRRDQLLHDSSHSTAETGRHSTSAPYVTASPCGPCPPPNIATDRRHDQGDLGYCGVDAALQGTREGTSNRPTTSSLNQLPSWTQSHGPSYNNHGSDPRFLTRRIEHATTDSTRVKSHRHLQPRERNQNCIVTTPSSFSGLAQRPRTRASSHHDAPPQQGNNLIEGNDPFSSFEGPLGQHTPLYTELAHCVSVTSRTNGVYSDTRGYGGEGSGHIRGHFVGQPSLSEYDAGRLVGSQDGVQPSEPFCGGGPSDEEASFPFAAPCALLPPQVYPSPRFEYNVFDCGAYPDAPPGEVDASQTNPVHTASS